MYSNAGFTLLETMISFAILTIVSVLIFVTVQTSTASTAVSNSEREVQRSVRDTVGAMTAELELAAKVDNETIGVTGISVRKNGVRVGADIPGDSVSFQVPTAADAETWSRSIQYRFIFEDVNQNGRLDPGEDLDADGQLSRKIVRQIDKDGDGDAHDYGESEPVGGTNSLSEVTFALNADGDILTVRVASRLALENSQRKNVETGHIEANFVSASLQARVYLLN